MSHPSRRPSSPASRKQREQRAYGLAVGGGIAGVVGVVWFLLAIVTSLTVGWPIVLILVAVACAFAFRRTVGS